MAAPISRELKVALKLINEQTAIMQSLISALVDQGFVHPDDLTRRTTRLLSDPQRAVQLAQTFQKYMEEMSE
jgi:hypothetical protein